MKTIFIGLRLLILLGSLTLITACGGGSHPSVSTPPPAVTDNGSARNMNSHDVLRVGDTLNIRLSGVPVESEFMSQEKVDTEGNISMPYLGPFKAAGLTTSQLKLQIENAYRARKIYATPNITIIPEARFVNVNGEVRIPQRIPYTSDLTALSAITACGSFTDYADKKNIKILRRGQIILFNAVAALNNPALDIPLQAGDQMQINRTIF